jgi:hypothetical protein
MTLATMLRTLALALAGLVPSGALAEPLSSSVTRVSMEPNVVVAPANAGKTPLERYRAAAARPYAAGTPLVVIARLPFANSPDVVTVTDAHRDGGKISVAIETRRFDGDLSANVVTTPLVEVALGALPNGTYTIDVVERVLHFSKYGEPQTATNPKPGLHASITFTTP